MLFYNYINTPEYIVVVVVRRFKFDLYKQTQITHAVVYTYIYVYMYGYVDTTLIIVIQPLYKN